MLWATAESNWVKARTLVFQSEKIQEPLSSSRVKPEYATFREVVSPKPQRGKDFIRVLSSQTDRQPVF